MTATVRRRAVKAVPAPDTSPARSFARVVGVDLSLTSTGVVILHHGDPERSLPPDPPQLETIAYNHKVGNDATLWERCQRIGHVGFRLRDLIVNSLDLVIIEGASHGSVGGHVWDRAGAWWYVVDHALRMGCLVVAVAPMTRAKWATGNGRADKAAVAAAMTRRMPDTIFNNSDEADAAALAWMGAQRLGWRTATKTELEALNSVHWPTGVHQ